MRFPLSLGGHRAIYQTQSQAYAESGMAVHHSQRADQRMTTWTQGRLALHNHSDLTKHYLQFLFSISRDSYIHLSLEVSSSERYQSYLSIYLSWYKEGMLLATIVVNAQWTSPRTKREWWRVSFYDEPFHLLFWDIENSQSNAWTALAISGSTRSFNESATSAVLESISMRIVLCTRVGRTQLHWQQYLIIIWCF